MHLSTLSIVALVLLAVVATVLVVIAAIHLGRERRQTAEQIAKTERPRWFEILLAIVLLVVLVALAVAFAVELTPVSGNSGEAEVGGDWRAQARSGLFLGVMLAVAALALIFFVVLVIARTPERIGVDPGTAVGTGVGAEPDPLGSPAGTRLLGLLLLVLGILVLGWTYLAPPGQAALVLHVLYPASIAVAIVLLFDKATRSWTPKGRAEGIREWLLCDLIVIALILGFLNLEQLGNREAYGGFFWDVVHVAAFFFMFWVLDRTQFRGRFLVGAGYLTLLPLLLLLWRWVQEIEAPAELSWWSTVWPTFLLGLAFFVLEIISLIALRGARGHVIPAIKDGIFVALYAIFLAAAVPSTE